MHRHTVHLLQHCTEQNKTDSYMESLNKVIKLVCVLSNMTSYKHCHPSVMCFPFVTGEMQCTQIGLPVTLFAW